MNGEAATETTAVRPAPSSTSIVAGVVLTVLLGALAAWLLLTAATGTGPATADQAVLDWFVGVRGAALTTAAVLVTNVGSTLAMAVLAILVGGGLWWRGRRAGAVYVVFTMAGGAAVFRLLKLFFDRPRPPPVYHLVIETNESLPSGHATMSVVVVGSLLVLGWAGSAALTRTASVLVALLWVAAVGITRIYLGVHWQSDVLAGWALGAAWLAACTTVWLVWCRHGLLVANEPSGA